MKRYILLIVLVILFPCVVNAKEYCKVISGNGKDIGSEVACGTEHFYIVENKNNTINMLAKYNLLVGDKIDYFDVEDIVNGNSDYCNSKAEEKGYNFYNVFDVYKYSEENNSNVFVGCRVYEELTPEHIRQDKKAIGVKLDSDNKTIYPLYGITYMNLDWANEETTNQSFYNYDENGNLIIFGTRFEWYFNGYKNELQNQGIDVDNVSFITFDKTINLLKTISGKDINVDLKYDEYNGNFNIIDPFKLHIAQMDIKDYVPNNYKWIHSVTYWLGSGYTDLDAIANNYNDYFIADAGFLCAMGRGECSFFNYPVGVGLRPMVTISSSNLEYLIKTKTDGHGTIEVIDHSPGGESIRFRVNSNKGYKLESVTVTTDNGEKVNFKEGEIQKNSDGTMSVDKNNFTMPFENVTIEARWRLDIINPNTGVETLLVVAIIILSTITMTVIIRRKDSEEIEIL